MAAGFNARLLELWDRGSVLDVNTRAVQALELWDVAAGDAVYERDSRLLDLRQALFGPVLDGVVECPACGAAFDLEVDLSEQPRPDAPPEILEIEAGGFTLLARPPRPDDLIEVGQRLDAGAMAEGLFERCIVRVAREGRPVSPKEIPAGLRAVVAEAMSARGMESPYLDLICGACAHAWRAPLDIARSLLGDLDSSAERLLDDVHRLATTYHWSQEEILALSPRRRRHYLEAIG